MYMFTFSAKWYSNFTADFWSRPPATERVSVQRKYKTKEIIFTIASFATL